MKLMELRESYSVDLLLIKMSKLRIRMEVKVNIIAGRSIRRRLITMSRRLQDNI